MLRVLFTLGGPGSGKGTQCKALSRRLDMWHLSAGELLRRAQAAKGPQAPVITACIDEGRIVPAEITIGLLRQEMLRLGTQRFFLIDGFPRNRDNFMQWFALMSDVRVAAVLHFVCSDDVLRQRLARRNEARSDDNPEAIEKRIAIYHTQTAEGLALFKERRIDVLDVDGEGPVDTVTDRAEAALKAILALI